ncbi:hypothetical protein Tco_1080026 [Tanacetum coccineum]|uniref:Uncharacterized protein n=1 Tax=Tanacetum coccineum TaxID=301880 RepID=A0ABQ5HUL5_9ASTR
MIVLDPHLDIYKLTFSRDIRFNYYLASNVASDIVITLVREVDINKKTENQAKMTKLSMEWKRLCKIKAKILFTSPLSVSPDSLSAYFPLRQGVQLEQEFSKKQKIIEEVPVIEESATEPVIVKKEEIEKPVKKRGVQLEQEFSKKQKIIEEVPIIEESATEPVIVKKEEIEKPVKKRVEKKVEEFPYPLAVDGWGCPEDNGMAVVSQSDTEGPPHVKMDNPNITMEEYIRLEEEKARRRGRVYNWKTATYGKIWDNEDVHDLGSVETEFPAIVFNETLTSEAALSCEPTVSSLNNEEIEFKISLDESNDEDCTIIFDKNSFSYKIIYVNDLKTDSENDNDKVNMLSFLSPEPMVSYFNDLDYFNDFENEFPAIVYNDAPNKDNDDDKIDIEHSSGDLSIKSLPDVINTDVGAYAHGSNKLLETRPRERNIDEYWWRIYISGDLKVLES